jgi:glycerol-3-phosphate cytidylyltransferase
MTVIGYAPGAYDMFHIGHLNILRRAKAACDILIAGVATDEVVEQVKGRRPVVPHNERMEIVGSITYVDEVVTDPTSDKFEMLERVRFDVFFKGDDWKGTPRGNSLEARFGEVGVRVVYLPYTAHTSSTLLRAFIARSA